MYLLLPKCTTYYLSISSGSFLQIWIYYSVDVMCFNQSPTKHKRIIMPMRFLVRTRGTDALQGMCIVFNMIRQNMHNRKYWDFPWGDGAYTIHFPFLIFWYWKGSGFCFSFLMQLGGRGGGLLCHGYMAAANRFTLHYQKCVSLGVHSYVNSISPKVFVPSY